MEWVIPRDFRTLPISERGRLSYLSSGVTYLHLMPLFKAPKGDNDGGYAVSSYREVESTFG